MEYSKMTKEQLVAEISAREAEVQQVREQIDVSKQLQPHEHKSLKWTYCRECGNRLVDPQGCNACSAAKAVLLSQNGRE